MPRSTTVVSELVELIEDVRDSIHKRALLDGVICEDDFRLMQVAHKALWKALDTQNGFILAKNVLDNGGIGDNALRRDREHKRDKADAGTLVYLDDYRRNASA